MQRVKHVRHCKQQHWIIMNSHGPSPQGPSRLHQTTDNQRYCCISSRPCASRQDCDTECMLSAEQCSKNAQFTLHNLGTGGRSRAHQMGWFPHRGSSPGHCFPNSPNCLVICRSPCPKIFRRYRKQCLMFHFFQLPFLHFFQLPLTACPQRPPQMSCQRMTLWWAAIWCA